MSEHPPQYYLQKYMQLLDIPRLCRALAVLGELAENFIKANKAEQYAGEDECDRVKYPINQIVQTLQRYFYLKNDDDKGLRNEGLEPESAEGRKLDESEEEEVKVAEGGQELKVSPENEEEEEGKEEILPLAPTNEPKVSSSTAKKPSKSSQQQQQKTKEEEEKRYLQQPYQGSWTDSAEK